MKKLNVPNTLTLARIVLIPIFVLFIAYDFFNGADNEYVVSRLIVTLIFGIACITDLLDGKIARKKGLVTDFGKFLDPLADKFLIFSALIAICFSDYVFPDTYLLSKTMMSSLFFWTSVLIMFRELSVTSMRLVVAKTGVVIAASWIAKVKTTFQMIGILVIVLEPLLPFTHGVLSLLMMAVMLYFTIRSGIDYIKTYWKYLDTNK